MIRKGRKWVLVFLALGALVSTACCLWSGGKTRCPSQKYLPIINRFLEMCGLPEVENSEELIEATSSWTLAPTERFSGELLSLCSIKDEHAFYNDLSLLRMTQAVPAYAATYDCAVIFGGPLPAVRQRLDFLAREWQRGVRFKQIIFLCGVRGRYKTIEEQEHFFDSRYNPFPTEENWRASEQTMPDSEEGIAKFVWAQMLLPRAWRDTSSGVKVVFLLAEPGDERPVANRQDTLRIFRSYYQETFPARIMFVSSQPFICLDACRLEKFFQRENYDIAGPGFAQGVLKYHWASRVCLHTLAVWLQETRGCLNLNICQE
ncbi:hypothetical protein [Candidatus Chlamydia sanziniae]|uniref:Lipoprotein n=1 Tax=Candidatus Chlamydia sanziniae TaxID=1806891 RepID=A0A1A9HTH2_9CHLA|nr:hypothetical protein [Candidatus Chlamydia sanziniae]ANH78289.1 hypothetical protein Cs308_0118 [Candidatus Chlamydia sanziniae]